MYKFQPAEMYEVGREGQVMCDSIFEGWGCTRPIEHPMPHAAHGSSDWHPLAIWDDEAVINMEDEHVQEDKNV